MSLSLMKKRIDHKGGAKQTDRMIQDKLRSMLSATGASYQSATFTEYPNFEQEFIGLMNPVKNTEDYDIKMISIPYDAEFSVGTVFNWKNNDSLWIIYLQDMSELAYFRGKSRRCDHKIKWVNKNRELLEAPASIIGPSVRTFDSKSSESLMGNYDASIDNIILLVSRNDINESYFQRYQTLIVEGVTYQIQSLDLISMPGVIQIAAEATYSNLIDDNIEEDISNHWNVLPLLDRKETDSIIGPDSVKPQFIATYSSLAENGKWGIAESNSPAKIIKIEGKEALILWDSMKSGSYTIIHQLNGEEFRKTVIVESLL